MMHLLKKSMHDMHLTELPNEM